MANAAMLPGWRSPTCARADRTAEKDKPATPDSRTLRNLVPRLALLALVALGWRLWNSTFFPQDRELIWRLDDHPESITQVEVQIYDHTAALLQREDSRFERAPGELV